jgi:hypothetical protein
VRLIAENKIFARVSLYQIPNIEVQVRRLSPARWNLVDIEVKYL